MRLSNLVLKPIITEKSYTLASEGRYVFKVNMSATKRSVAKEIKRLYGVDVIEVSTAVMPGKSKRIARSRLMSKPLKWKKATVKLKEGQSIDLFPKE
ncbi:50S ribosomal protein L23 [candidate division WWE3 bacterium]|uniref:Large ribosomal subunit protein uL23 n=1 Tax=candidate division WWE3 bacterium TaxID=2053526 RepID=A0A7X9HSF7_UNCKA|nr:50S ribosomal protein L23 [candidate division WWE3 bacterium]